MTSELSGKIDTSRWLNQANIVTPEFKRAQIEMKLHDSERKEIFDISMNANGACGSSNLSFSTE